MGFLIEIGKRRRSIGYIVWLGGLLLLLAACQDRPTPTVSIITPTPPPTNTPEGIEADPTIAALLTQTAVAMQPTATVTQIAAVPTGETTCPPPEGWVRYTVLPGDSLFSLAQFTGATTEEIKDANCLLDDLLGVNEVVYLPRLPLRPPPVVVGGGDGGVVPTGGQPESGGACRSPLQCPYEETVAFHLPNLGPDTPEPCRWQGASAPYLDVAQPSGDLSSTPPAVVSQERGQRAYFFACNFVNPTQWAISLTGPDGQAVPFEIPRYFPPGWQAAVAGSAAQLTLAWNMLCDLGPGRYTLRVTDNATGSTAVLGIDITSSSSPKIAAIPDAAVPGNLIHLYFCDYTGFENETVTAALYYQTSATEAGQDYNLAIRFPVVIGPDGWAFVQIQSLANDPIRAYLVQDEQFGEAFFWLVAP